MPVIDLDLGAIDDELFWTSVSRNLPALYEARNRSRAQVRRPRRMPVISVPAPLMRSERASRSGLIDAIEGGEIGVIELEPGPAKDSAPRPSFSGERPFRFAKSAPPRTPALAARTLPHSRTKAAARH